LRLAPGKVVWHATPVAENERIETWVADTVRLLQDLYGVEAIKKITVTFAVPDDPDTTQSEDLHVND
jgi:hypothetical protein